jgi:hypothetical protein
MKKLLMVAGVCLLIGGLAFGQNWTPQARVEVPFDFVVGETALPAGTYVVSTPARSTSVIMFTNPEKGKTAFASNIDISAKPHAFNPTSSLVFVLDAQGRHVLHQVWVTGQGHGHGLTHEKGIAEPK